MIPPSNPVVGRIYDPASCADLFPERSLFLSASVPCRRAPERMQTPAEAATNRRYVERSQPLRIRESLSHLCRFAFRRGLGLVFGGHPAISPLLLEASSRFSTGPEPQRKVTIFQSLFYLDKTPAATLALGKWENGQLFWTRPMPASAPDEATSLTEMRIAMTSAPGLIAAVFIGGMEGLLEEASLFDRYNRGAPMFALGSTGSAAAQLFEDGVGSLEPIRFRGRHLNDPEVLSSVEAYSVVFQRIFADLGFDLPRVAR